MAEEIDQKVRALPVSKLPQEVRIIRDAKYYHTMPDCRHVVGGKHTEHIRAALVNERVAPHDHDGRFGIVAYGLNEQDARFECKVCADKRGKAGHKNLPNVEAYQ